jgi:hypothetical protein
MEVLDGEGQQVGMVNARVRDSEAAKDEEDVTASQVDIETLTRRMMGKLNVEFEYQVRQALKGKLQTTAPAAPKPEAVDAQDLTGAPAEAVSVPAAPAVPAPAPARCSRRWRWVPRWGCRRCRRMRRLIRCRRGLCRRSPGVFRCR